MAYISFMGAVIKPIFMHDPIGFLTMWSSSFVKYKSLSQSNSFEATIDDLITASSFPKSGSRSTICSSPCGIFLVFVTEEIPIILRCRSNFALLCTVPINLKQGKIWFVNKIGIYTWKKKYMQRKINMEILASSIYLGYPMARAY